MMRLYGSMLLILLCAWTTVPRKLVKTKLNAQISIALPKELVAVSPEAISQHYHSLRKPMGIFANKDYTVDFSVSTSATYWPDADIDIAQQFFKSSFYNLYNRVDWISEGTREIRSKNYVYFEFNAGISRGAHEPSTWRYIYIQYLIEPKRTLVFSFSCIEKLGSDWQKTAHTMMEHVRVK